MTKTPTAKALLQRSAVAASPLMRMLSFNSKRRKAAPIVTGMETTSGSR